MGFTYLKDAVTLELDSEKCNGCGMCLLVCPHEVLASENGKVGIYDKDACMECGACQRTCAPGAITGRAGVGRAAAVINAALGKRSPSCSCGGEKGGPPGPRQRWVPAIHSVGRSTVSRASNPTPPPRRSRKTSSFAWRFTDPVPRRCPGIIARQFRRRHARAARR